MSEDMSHESNHSFALTKLMGSIKEINHKKEDISAGLKICVLKIYVRGPKGTTFGNWQHELQQKCEAEREENGPESSV